MNPTATNPPLPVRHRLNKRAAIALGGLALFLVVGGTALWAVQSQRGGAWLAQAKKMAESNEPAIALGYVNRFLAISPRDPEALEFRAKLLRETALSVDDFEEARKAHETAIREAPEGPSRQETRRRAVELNLGFGYVEVALTHANELIKQGADDAEAHRLLATALEASAKVRSADQLEEALKSYEKAIKLGPEDPKAAARLAVLYADVFDSPGKAQGVLDEHLKAAKDPVAARLVRYRHFASHKQEEKARAELAAAIADAPGDRNARLASAEEALSRRDFDGAKAHLDAVPQDKRADASYQYWRGRTLYERGDVPEAMASYREGLKLTRGAHPLLTFQLALAFIAQGKTSEAAPLVEAYKRLTWDPATKGPSLGAKFLAAAFALKADRPAEAIRALEEARLKAPEELLGQINGTLGQAYESTNRREESLAAYRRASLADPKRPDYWLAEARLLSAWRPQEAIDALVRGLKEVPNDPKLLVAKAELLDRQRRRRPNDDALATEAAKAAEAAKAGASNSPALALVEAERFANEGRSTEALKGLEAAEAKFPAESRLRIGRAALLGRLGRDAEGLELLATVAQDGASLRLAKAQMLARLGRNVEAERALVNGSEALPARDQADCWRGLAEMASGWGDLARAREAVVRWGELLPDDVRARWRLLELALAARDPAAAAGATRDLEAMDGQGLYAELAKVWELLLGPVGSEDPAAVARRLEDALPKLNALIEAHGQQAVGHHLKGQVLEKLGRLDEAANCYRSAVERSGGPLALGRLASVLARQGRSQALLDLASEHPERAPLVLRLASEAALAAGDKAQARQRALDAMAAAPENPALRLWLAGTQQRLGDPAAAEATLEELVRLRPKEAAGWLALVKLQSDLKRPEAASKTIARGLPLVEARNKSLFEAQARVIVGDRPKAEAAYRAALAQGPDDPGVVEEVVRFLEANDQTAKAEVALRELLAQAKAKGRPRPRWAAQKLALLLSAKPLDDASWQESYRLMLDDMAVSDTAADRLVRAQVLARGARPQHRREALAILEGLAASSPEDLAVRALLAQVYSDEGLPEKSRPHAQRVALGGAPSGLAFFARLLIDEGTGSLPEAQRQVARLAALEPNAPRTVELRARLLKAQGDPQGAQGLVKAGLEALRAAPEGRGPEGTVIASGYVGLMAQIGAPEALEAIARDVARDWPGSVPRLVPALARAGRIAAGLDLCEAAAKAQGTPGRDAAKSSAALAASGSATKEQLARSEALIAPLRKADPNAADLTLALAIVKHYQGEFDAEVKLYEELLARPGTALDVRFLNNLAWTLSEDLGRPEEALKRIEQALQQVGWHPQFLDTRGVVLTRLGQLERAVQDLEEAARASNSPVTLFHLARARRKAGDLPRCKEGLELAIKAGLALDSVPPAERGELEALLKENGLGAQSQ